MRDSIMDTFSDTKGLIIDLNGRPRFSIFPLATWFSKDPVPREKFEAPLISFSHGELFKGLLQYPPFFLEPPPDRHYNKPVVVLIDANMQSHSETAAIILRNIPHVTLVGSPTTGTTGNAIPINILGGISIGYTSQKVSNTDGSPFQNIDVVPDVLVEPTIKGIKQGRDEVIDKGLEVLTHKINDRKNAPSSNLRN